MLPKIEHPINSIKMPTSGKTLNFRPFLVKEEKIMLMAKESGDELDISRAIRQIVRNCCVDQNFSVEDLTTTELGYVYVRLWTVSVDNQVRVSYVDNEDNKNYDFDVDLTRVEVKQDGVVDATISATKDIKLVMRYPRTGIYDTLAEAPSEYMTSIIAQCIDKIYDGDDVCDPKNYSREQLEAFVDDLSVPTLTSINKFLANAPRLEYVIEYKNSLGSDRKIALNALNDFFSFR